MAIQPLNFSAQPPQAYSSFDFSPLAKLGDLYQQRQQQDALQALQQQYGNAAQMPAAAPGGPFPTSGTTSVPYAGRSGNSYADAISRIESSGRYDLLGPVTRSGDRAYGKYQVMGSNIPSWTQQTFGKPMTKEEFLANPAAQDAVFNNIFGGYANKYGPAGAAKAWFAGERGMNNPNASDLYGTTVDSYANKFLRYLGGG